MRYPATLLDGLLSLEHFKLDQNHDQDYVQQWGEKLRAAIETTQPSLRPVLSLESFDKETADGLKTTIYFPRITIYVHIYRIAIY